MDNNFKLVSVIEVGSRAVRMLVFGIKGDSLFFLPKYNKSELNQFNLKKIIENNDLSQINRTEKIIASFSKEAMNQIKVLGVKIFGTQALREISESSQDKKKMIKDFFPNLKLLTPKQEAEHSFFSAYALTILANKDNNKNRVSGSKKILVFDVGSGSMEMIYGGIKKSNIRKSISIPLGSKKILEAFYNVGGKFDAICDFLDKKISSLDFSLDLTDTKTIISGGMPTQLGWLMKNENSKEKKKYKPALIHDYLLTIDELTKYEIFFKKNIKEENIKDDVSFLSSCLAVFFLVKIYKKFNLNHAYLNAYGTRHGYAYLNAQKKTGWNIKSVSFL